MAMKRFVVAGDQYRVIDRRMNEIKRQLNQAGGSPVDPDRVLKTLQLVVDGQGSNQDTSEVNVPTTITWRTIAEQVDFWEETLQNVDSHWLRDFKKVPVPIGADSWVVVPHPELLDRRGYHMALDYMFVLISDSRKFRNFHRGEILPEHLRLTDEAVKFHKALDKASKYSSWHGGYAFWVFAIKMNMAHSEFAGHCLGSAIPWGVSPDGKTTSLLDPYCVAGLLLTHPELVTASSHNTIGCGGTQFRIKREDTFDQYFAFNWSATNDALAFRLNSTSGIRERLSKK